MSQCPVCVGCGRGAGKVTGYHAATWVSAATCTAFRRERRLRPEQLGGGHRPFKSPCLARFPSLAEPCAPQSAVARAITSISSVHPRARTFCPASALACHPVTVIRTVQAHSCTDHGTSTSWTSYVKSRPRARHMIEITRAVGRGTSSHAADRTASTTRVRRHRFIVATRTRLHQRTGPPDR